MSGFKQKLQDMLKGKRRHNQKRQTKNSNYKGLEIIT